MGNKSTKTPANQEYSQDGLKRFTQNFTFIRSEKDPRFGNDIMVYSEKSSKKLLAVVNKATEDENFTNALKTELKHRLTLDHKNFARIVGFTKSEDETLCGVNHHLSVYSEYYENDLEMEIADRIPKKEYFQEAEIWYVANSVISFGSFFQNSQIYHGDIRPLNILMDEDGSLYLLDHGLLNPSKDNLNKAFSGDKNVYLSHREMEILKSKSESADYDVYKADVFSAGMTLLYMCHLENPISIYNFTDHSIDTNLLAQYISDVENNYSKPLADLIRWMTELSEIKRPDFIQLNSTLQSQGKPVSPDALPQINHSNQSSASKNQRGVNSPSNLHYEKSPISDRRLIQNQSNLVNSQVSSLNGYPGNSQMMPVSNVNLIQSQILGTGVVQGSPYKNAAAGHNGIPQFK